MRRTHDCALGAEIGNGPDEFGQQASMCRRPAHRVHFYRFIAPIATAVCAEVFRVLPGDMACTSVMRFKFPAGENFASSSFPMLRAVSSEIATDV